MSEEQLPLVGSVVKTKDGREVVFLGKEPYRRKDGQMTTVYRVRAWCVHEGCQESFELTAGGFRLGHAIERNLRKYCEAHRWSKLRERNAEKGSELAKMRWQGRATTQGEKAAPRAAQTPSRSIGVSGVGGAGVLELMLAPVLQRLDRMIDLLEQRPTGAPAQVAASVAVAPPPTPKLDDSEKARQERVADLFDEYFVDRHIWPNEGHGKGTLLRVGTLRPDGWILAPSGAWLPEYYIRERVKRELWMKNHRSTSFVPGDGSFKDQLMKRAADPVD